MNAEAYSGNPKYPAAPPSYFEATGQQPPPPPPGFKPVTSQPQAVPIVSIPHVGPEPLVATCPNCGLNIETVTRTEPGLIAYLSGALIFLFGFWCGCCLIPCCIDSCMDVHHSCPNCKAYIGRYRR